MQRILSGLIRRPTADLSRFPLGFDLRAINVLEGIRAALSVTVLVALNEFLDLPGLMEAALAAWLACLCDQGGPIRRRLPAVIGFTLGAAAIASLAGLARNGGVWAAVPVASAGLFCLSMLSIYGQAATVVGNLLGVMLVLALDRPLPMAEAGIVALACLAGGGWATLLTMVIWRLHPYRPARQAVGRAYRALAAMAQDLRHLVRRDRVSEVDWDAHARAHRRSVSEEIETTRGVVMDTLRVRGPVTRRAAETLIRTEIADQVFGALVAASEVLAQPGDVPEAAVLERVLRRTRVLLVELARAVEHDGVRRSRRVNRALDGLTEEVARLSPGTPLGRIGDVLLELLHSAVTLSGTAHFLPASRQSIALPTLRSRIAGPLRANLNWDSVTLRHALRVALVAIPAVAVSVPWAGSYQHWLTITWVLTMQPHFAMTIMRAVERIVGTIIGGVIAAGILVVAHTPLAMAAVIFPLAVVAMAVRQVSFGLFITAVTPLVVVLTELGETGASGWEIAGTRALLTVIAGLLALAGGLVLWPSWEPGRLFEQIRAAIAAHATFAEREISAIVGDATPEAVEAARRAAGVASNNVEASLSRALHEPGHANRFRLEAALVIDAALRRMGGRLIALQLDEGLQPMLTPADWRRWRDWLATSLRALAGNPPDLLLTPHPVLAGSDAARTETLGRLARQVELIAGALKRIAAGRSLPSP
ncbi:MAG: FUSC family protein [Acetobacteraceae bacterium]|nr:FUSC family protein [Acetobacteraceae bacterium]